MSSRHAQGVKNALAGFARRNREPFYFCKCGTGFLRAERGEYYKHKSKCEPKEVTPKVAQLSLFGG